MLRNEDLAAAVKAGVITAEQQSAIEAQASGRRAARPFANGRDERFRFLRGFNDVFLTLGVLLVTGAFLSRWSLSLSGGGVMLSGAAVLWLLSEVLVGRTKAVLPGIAAVVGIGLFCTLAGCAFAWETLGQPFQAGLGGVGANQRLAFAVLWNLPYRIWFCATGAGGLGVLLFYLRFRLPFALLPLAFGVMTSALLLVVQQFGFDTTQSLLNGVALVLGLITFAAAMHYDRSDPGRLTRRADCGFWLHLAAAPFIVHPLIALLGRGNRPSVAFITFAVVAILGLVALIVDRRALLVSSLTYLGVAIGYLVSSPSGTYSTEVSHGFTTTLLLLGAFVIAMGLGWHTLRGLILKPFSGQPWLAKLPPVQVS